MWTRSISLNETLAVFATLALLLSSAPYAAADAKFLPKDTKFKSDQKLKFEDVLFKDTKFKDFRAIKLEEGKDSATETYETTFKGLVGKRGKGKDFKPFKLTGTLAKQFDKTPSNGTFDTEIVALNLSGSIPKTKDLVSVKKAKGIPSSGAAIFDLSRQEPILVDSFFDVFFQLTIGNDPPILENGGESEVRYTLAQAPEPASMALVVAGLFGLGLYRRQQKRDSKTDEP